MFIIRKRLPYKVSEPTGVFFCADFHIGSSAVDYTFLIEELARAGEYGDRICIFGDTFDAIVPQDHKRYKPEALHQRVSMTSNVLDEQLDWAEEILRPHANLIDVIGLGNHEKSVEKYHGTDLTARLIRRLQRAVTSDGHIISYGGYTGFMDYRFSRISDGKHCDTRRLVIYYHHGGGGSAPVTKGMIDFARKSSFIDSDVVVLGHKHNRIADTGAIKLSCPQHGDEPLMRQQIFVMCGSYMDTYKAGRGGYASDWGLAPQAKGGARLLIHFERKSGIKRMELVH